MRGSALNFFGASLGKALKAVLWLMVLMGVSSSLWAMPRAQSNDLKAVVCHKLIEHIIWPELKRREAFHLGVLGSDEAFISSLSKLSKAQKLQGRKVRLIRLDGIDRVHRLDTLVVCNSNVEQTYDIYQRIKNKRVLLITDSSADREYVMLNL